MSDGILVTPQQLIDAAAVLRQSAKTVQISIDAVDHQIQSLGPTRFEGVSADTIRAKYARLREKFYNFKPMVERVAGKMELISAEFVKVDRESAQ